MRLQDKYFNAIKDGSKLYEVRIFDDKRKLVKLKDNIKFYNNNGDYLFLTVTYMEWFPSFEKLFEKISVDCILAGKNKNEAIEEYRKFPGYAEGESNYGVVIFGFE